MTSLSGSGLNINDYLAAASTVDMSKLRAADNDIRAQIQRKAADNGGVVTDITYSTGPDGQLYITGATVQSLKRTVGARTSLDADDPRLVTSAGLNQNNQQSGQGVANDNRLAKPANPISFGDILSPRLNMGPLAFALLQEQLQPQNDSRSHVLNELRTADAGVRSHERQHHFAAGGLASGAPRYEFTQGPDGKLYATEGEVRISMTLTNDPEKAARDTAGFFIAATAPGDASSADVSVARGAYARAAYSYTQTNRLGFYNVLDLAA